MRPLQDLAIVANFLLGFKGESRSGVHNAKPPIQNGLGAADLSLVFTAREEVKEAGISLRANRVHSSR